MLIVKRKSVKINKRIIVKCPKNTKKLNNEYDKCDFIKESPILKPQPEICIENDISNLFLDENDSNS